MRISTRLARVGVLALAGAMAQAWADDGGNFAAPTRNSEVAAFGSYSLLGAEQGGTEALSSNGGGGGVSALIRLAGVAFIDTSYQYTTQTGADSGVHTSVRANEFRVGPGLEFRVADLPLSAFGKFQYVYLEYQTSPDSGEGQRFTEQGPGVDFGLRMQAWRMQFSAGGGYVNLHHKRGPEAFAKVELPFASRYYAFGEYRYDWLGNPSNPDALRLIAYHLGLGLYF